MKIKFVKLCLLSVICLLFSGCSCFNSTCNNEEAIKLAKESILNDTNKCVLVKDGKMVVAYSGRGVSPLLELYKTNSTDMVDGVVVDKVIGRAAAFIVINGGANRVYALLISEEAKQLLEEHKIVVEYDEIVPRILNYKRDGLCPLEESVLGEDDPKIALVKLENKIKSFRK